MSEAMSQNEQFVVVRIPGHIEPIERGERFEDPLQEKLEAAGLGEITGGGSQLSEADAEGRRTIVYCEIEIVVKEKDLAKACALIKEELIRLEVPEGSALHFQVDGKEQVEPIHERPN